MAPSRHDWKIVDWDVKPQHNQPTNQPSRHDWKIVDWDVKPQHKQTKQVLMCITII